MKTDCARIPSRGSSHPADLGGIFDLLRYKSGLTHFRRVPSGARQPRAPIDRNCQQYVVLLSGSSLPRRDVRIQQSILGVCDGF